MPAPRTTEPHSQGFAQSAAVSTAQRRSSSKTGHSSASPKTFGRSLHFLTDPLERQALAHDGRFVESPHHGDRGWIALRIVDVRETDWEEVNELLDCRLPTGRSEATNDHRIAPADINRSDVLNHTEEPRFWEAHRGRRSDH